MPTWCKKIYKICKIQCFLYYLVGETTLPRFYLSNYIFKKIHKSSQFNYEKAFIYRYFFIYILSFFIMILFIYIHEAFILSLFCSPLYKRTEDSEEQRLSSRWTNSKNGIFRVCIRDLSPFLNESLYLAN